MTTIYTASYQSYRPEMGHAVVTSLGLPRWRPRAGTWPRCWYITPTPALLHATAGDFNRDYPVRLTRFGAAKIARALEHIAHEHQAQQLVLLCHDHDPTDCGRSLFADWWLAVTGEVITEIT